MIRLLLAVWVLMYFASPATGDMIVYGWRSPEGAHEFTDDINRVPVAHLENVRQIEVDGLENYEKFTKDDCPFRLLQPDATVQIEVDDIEFDEEIIVTPEPDRRRKRHRNPNKR